MNISECTSLSIDNKEVESLWLDDGLAYSTIEDGKTVANTFAYSVLSAMDLSGTATYNGKTFNVYNTFTNPPFITLGTGRRKPFPVSPHIVAAAQHYLDYPTTIALSCGTVTVSAWVNLKTWALANGWDSSYFSKGDLGDIHLGLLSSSSVITDECIPYFADQNFIDRQFHNKTLKGVIGWQASQDFTQAIPYTFNDTSLTGVAHWYTVNSENNLFTGELSAVISEMGPQYPVYNEDSCKPVYLMLDGQPIVVSHAHTANKSTYVGGPNYIYAHDVLKDFVEAHGDTLKTPHLVMKT